MIFKKIKTKSDVEKWLISMSISNYIIHEDLSVDVKGHVFINNKKLKEIPIQFNKVEGVFDCSYNKLKSLKGVPSIVGSRFKCSYNKLSSLKFSPEVINGDYDCSHNELNSLEFCPHTIIKMFDASNNKIKELSYFPRNIGTDIFLQFNLIERLANLPQQIKGVLDLHNNHILNMAGLPQYVSGFVNLSNNKISNFDNNSLIEATKLQMVENPLSNILNFNIDLKEFIFFDLTHLDSFTQEFIKNYNSNNFQTINNIKDNKSIKTMEGVVLIYQETMNLLVNELNIIKNNNRLLSSLESKQNTVKTKKI